MTVSTATSVHGLAQGTIPVTATPNIANGTGGTAATPPADTPPARRRHARRHPVNRMLPRSATGAALVTMLRRPHDARMIRDVLGDDLISPPRDWRIVASLGLPTRRTRPGVRESPAQNFVLRWFVFRGSTNASTFAIDQSLCTIDRSSLVPAATCRLRRVCCLQPDNRAPRIRARSSQDSMPMNETSSHQPAAHCFSNPCCRRICPAHGRTGLSAASRRSAATTSARFADWPGFATSLVRSTKPAN